MLVDLRSDTLTQPSPAMRRAMAEAEVGDSSLGEDPTVRDLEERFADLVGKPAALFVPSGTMANQIALRLLGRPTTLVVSGRRQHVMLYEAGAAGINSGALLYAVDDDDGTLDRHRLRALVEEQAGTTTPVSAVFVEDTHLRSGGRPWPLDALRALSDLGVDVHLDGARLWNAAVATDTTVAERAIAATTVTCCLSKGLGAPVGSVLAGPADLVAEGRLHRRRLGGAMRQAGVLAAAGLVALANVDRLAVDHEHARLLADAVAARWPGAVDPDSVRTNVVAFSPPDPAGVVAALGAGGVLASILTPSTLRFVTHLDVDRAGIDHACAAIRAC